MRKNQRDTQKVTISLTEVGGECETMRKVVKATFLDKDRAQANDYIKDLERTVEINKQIISDLLKTSQNNGQAKKMIEKLNNENAVLQGQLKKVIKERNDTQAKLLITEQIIENYKKHENDACKELLEKQAELVDQLNRKEFMLQNLERKYGKALSVMNKFAHKDQEIGRTLKELRADHRAERKVTNVVEENEYLQTALAQEREKVKELTKELLELKSRRPHYRWEKGNKTTNELVPNNEPIEIEQEASIQLKKRIRPADQIEIARLNKKVEDLYKLNVKLSEALEQANEKLSVSQRQRPLTAKGQNKSAISCFAGNRATARIETAPALENMRLHKRSKAQFDFVTDENEKETEQGVQKEFKMSFGEAEKPKGNFSELSSIVHEDGTDKNDSVPHGVDEFAEEIIN